MKITDTTMQNINQRLIELFADFLDSEPIKMEEEIAGLKDSVDRTKSELHIRMAKAAFNEYCKTMLFFDQPTEGTKLYSEAQMKEYGNECFGDGAQGISKRRELPPPFLIHKDKGENKFPSREEFKELARGIALKWGEAGYSETNAFDYLMMAYNKIVELYPVSTPLDKEGYSKEEMIKKHCKKFLEWKSKCGPAGFYKVADHKNIQSFISSILDDVSSPLQKDKEEMTDQEIEKMVRNKYEANDELTRYDIIDMIKAYRDRLKNKQE